MNWLSRFATPTLPLAPDDEVVRVFRCHRGPIHGRVSNVRTFAMFGVAAAVAWLISEVRGRRIVVCATPRELITVRLRRLFWVPAAVLDRQALANSEIVIGQPPVRAVRINGVLCRLDPRWAEAALATAAMVQLAKDEAARRTIAHVGGQ